MTGPASGGVLAEEGDLLLEEEPELPGLQLHLGASTREPLPDPQIPLPTIDPLGIDGNITIGGSATLYPLTRQMYRRFVREGYAGVMKIERVGTGEGFRLLCSTGTADIVNAGRQVRSTEVERCTSINRVPIPFSIGKSAVTIFVHPSNNFLTELSMETLEAIFNAGIWSDIDPTWPDEPIVHLIPRLDSDEFALFEQVVLDGESSSLLTSANAFVIGTNSELLQLLAANRYTIGFADQLLVRQAGEEFLRAVPLEQQLPNAETIGNGGYPLIYPLYLYTDIEIIQRKPQIAAFLNFYLNHVNEEIEQVGYFPTSVQEMDVSRIRLLEIIEGGKNVIHQAWERAQISAP